MEKYLTTIYKILIVHHFCCLTHTFSHNVNCENNLISQGEKENCINFGSHNNKIEAKQDEHPKPITEFLDQLLDTTLFNTTMNFIVPGATIQLPRHTEEGSVDHLVMQAFFGIFWAAAWLATIAVPVTTTYFQFQPFGLPRSLESENEFHFKWKLNSEVANAIGLDWTTCLQKTVCQAHRSSEKYGVLGKAVQILFPADDNLHDDEDTMTKHTQSFQQAALNGAIGHNCNHIYQCFFDVLDVLIYLKNYCFTSLSERT